MRRPKFLIVLGTLGTGVFLSVFGYLAWGGLQRQPLDPMWYVPGGEAARGRQEIQEYGCGGCHVIAGIPGATGLVGPNLSGLKGRIYVGGALANTPDNLIRWIMDPQEVATGTAMPDLGVTEQEARDIAAFLYAE